MYKYFREPEPPKTICPVCGQPPPLTIQDLNEYIESVAGHHISYSEAEAAARLGVKVITLRDYRKRKWIAFCRVSARVRYLPRQLDAFLEKHETKVR